MALKEEWVKNWKNHIAGGFLFGAFEAVNDGPLTRAASAMKIAEEVPKLLEKMYDWLEARMKEQKPAQNGQNGFNQPQQGVARR